MHKRQCYWPCGMWGFAVSAATDARSSCWANHFLLLTGSSVSHLVPLLFSNWLFIEKRKKECLFCWCSICVSVGPKSTKSLIKFSIHVNSALLQTATNLIEISYFSLLFDSEQAQGCLMKLVGFASIFQKDLCGKKTRIFLF